MRMLSPQMGIRYYMERMAAHAELPEYKVLELMAILDVNPGKYDDTRMDKILAVLVMTLPKIKSVAKNQIVLRRKQK